MVLRGFPGSSAGKESACNAGDSSLIPALERSPGEGICHTLQYSWVSLVAQMMKNWPTMRETWVGSLGWQDPLEESMTTHVSILAWRISMDKGAWWATVHGILQDRILEWVALPFSRGSPQPRDQTQVSCFAGGFFTSWATREAQEYWSGKPRPSPVDLPDPGIKLESPALQADSLAVEPPRKPKNTGVGSLSLL